MPVPAYGAPQESARQSLCAQAHGGKSGLHRARCQVTPGGREPTESATERYRLSTAQAGPVRVKWCGKSAPRGWQHQRHGKPHLEQDQIGKHAAPAAVHVAHMRLPGRSLELRGDAHPRGMTVHDRTRLNGRLFSGAGRAHSTGRRTPPPNSRSLRERGRTEDVGPRRSGCYVGRLDCPAAVVCAFLRPDWRNSAKMPTFY